MHCRLMKSFSILFCVLTSIGLSTYLYAQQNIQRVALVIGNASYNQLGTLNNPQKDATQINSELTALGFSTKLIIDANEQVLRREIRAFSARSEGASVALVYYAGHGAQINGDNYLLPIDLDSPNRESDIQLSAIKVDDLLTSLKSPVKIVFLDACRDNPVLFKNLSKGRGSSFSRGLAEPKGSNSGMDISGGGIFIGYATDAGSVAADGSGQNSPFTEALLRHIRQPVSIDDMFSMVTRDVRQSTGNKQRPYKYASMEQVFCLTQLCGVLTAPREQRSNLTESFSESTNAEIQLALSENNIEKLEELAKKISGINEAFILKEKIEKNRQLFTNDWVVIDGTVDESNFFYYQPSSLRHGNGRTWVNVRIAAKGPISSANSTLPAFGKEPTQGPKLISMSVQVLDCISRKIGFSYREEYDNDGVPSKQFMAGNPRVVDLPLEIKGDTIFDELRGLVCLPKNAGRIVTSEVVKKDENWETLVSFGYDPGKFAVLKESVRRVGNEVTAIITLKGAETVKLPMYQYGDIVYKIVFRCDRGDFANLDADFLDVSGKLVGKLYEKNIMQWAFPADKSPFQIVHKTMCLSHEK